MKAEFLARIAEVEMSEEIDWDSLTFSLTPTDTMYITNAEMGEPWMPGELIPYGDMKISLLPGF